MTRASGIGLGIVVALATLGSAGSAAAAPAPVWQDAAASIPADAELAAVAAAPGSDGDVVVAVGWQAERAVAYRLAGGAWTQVALPASEARSAAVDVTLDGAGDAWVVGWQKGAQDGAPRRALLVRLHADAWREIPTAEDQPALTAVAAAGPSILAGDAAGAVHELGPTGVGPALSAIVPGSLTAVSSLAATGPRLAIGGGAPAAGAPAATALVDVDAAGASVRQAPSVPAAAAAQIVAVAARDGEQLAIDGDRPCGADGAAGGAPPGVWSRADGSAPWRRQGGPSLSTASRPCDVSLLADGAAFVVGGIDGRGAIWRRGASGWERTDRASSGELRGVAAVSEDDVWAVGDGGTLLHLAPPPPAPPPPAPPPPAPPPPPPSSDPPPAERASSAPTPSDEPPPAPPPAADRPPSTQGSSRPAPATTSQQAPAGDAANDVPARRAAPRPRRTARLLARLSVRPGSGRRLVVRFRLRARSRVDVRALVGGRVVGSAARAALARGPHVLFIRYRGRRPPTRLQIVARRLGAGAA